MVAVELSAEAVRTPWSDRRALPATIFFDGLPEEACWLLDPAAPWPAGELATHPGHAIPRPLLAQLSATVLRQWEVNVELTRAGLETIEARVVNDAVLVGRASAPRPRWYAYGAASVLEVLRWLPPEGDLLSTLPRALGPELPRLYQRRVLSAVKRHAAGPELYYLRRDGLALRLWAPGAAADLRMPVPLPADAVLVDPEDPLAQGFGLVRALVETRP
jgi:hypothetical protein